MSGEARNYEAEIEEDVARILVDAGMQQTNALGTAARVIRALDAVRRSPPEEEYDPLPETPDPFERTMPLPARSPQDEDHEDDPLRGALLRIEITAGVAEMVVSWAEWAACEQSIRGTENPVLREANARFRRAFSEGAQRSDV